LPNAVIKLDDDEETELTKHISQNEKGFDFAIKFNETAATSHHIAQRIVEFRKENES